MATVRKPPKQRFVLAGIDWDTYVLFSDQLGERHVRVTYDGRNLEFMTTSSEHEREKHLLSVLVQILAYEVRIKIAGYGSMTCRRKKKGRGLESDECYWIQNEPAVRGKARINLDKDPPPDLALEVEISRSALNRMVIYAELRVQEVWRWNGRTLRVFLLSSDGKYSESAKSKALPFLPLDELVRFLRIAAEVGETDMVWSFRDWVREQIRRGWK